MKKDVIYIDIEDDITAVIDKVKAAKSKVIALVPPKGNAVLQSVVNLKLLKRAAENAGKQPVVVTGNQALSALAGGVGVYVAKNLQSKPALPGEQPLETEDESLDVGDDTGTSVPLNDKTEDTTVSNDEVELSSDELAELEAENDPEEAAIKPEKPKKPKKSVPNFDDFRKKLLVVGGILLFLVIIFIVLFGRAKAKVVIRAETTPVNVSFEAKLNTDAQSDPASYNLRAVSQQTQKTLTQSFSATGQKDLGTKATGKITFSATCSPSTFGMSIPAGTTVSANNLNFITQSTATLDNVGAGCTLTDTVNVTAAQNGDQYNLSARSYSVSGYSGVSAKGTQMSGGTSNIVKVISQDDVNKAKDALNKQDTSQLKNDLKKKFTSGTTILEDTFTTSFGDITSEPAVGEQANSGQLTVNVTYSILGVSKQDLGAALDAYITSQAPNKDQQRVYDNGLSNMKLEKESSDAQTATYKISTVGQYGPQFDTDALKDQVKGKKYGDARSYLNDLPGVQGVDISLTPFWARTLPGTERISIKLDVSKNTLSQ